MQVNVMNTKGDHMKNDSNKDENYQKQMTNLVKGMGDIAGDNGESFVAGFSTHSSIVCGLRGKSWDILNVLHNIIWDVAHNTGKTPVEIVNDILKMEENSNEKSN